MSASTLYSGLPATAQPQGPGSGGARVGDGRAFGSLAYRTLPAGAHRPIVYFIDALSGPDGITCARCRRARSVGVKSCEFCDEDHR